MRRQHQNLALTLARKSSARFRLGAVIVRKNTVLSTGYNSMLSGHPEALRYLGLTWTQGLHAEIDALRSLHPEEGRGTHLYVARLLRDGRLGLARPCYRCQQEIEKFGIRRVYYTTSNGWDIFYPGRKN